MKKLLTLIAVVSLIGSMLSGCATNQVHTPQQVSYVLQTESAQSNLNRVDELTLVLLISGKITKQDAMSVYEQSRTMRHNLDTNVKYVWKHGATPTYKYFIIDNEHLINSLKTFIHVKGGYVVVVGRKSNSSLFVGNSK